MWSRTFIAEPDQVDALRRMVREAANAKARGLDPDIAIFKLIEVLQSSTEALFVLNGLVNNIYTYGRSSDGTTDAGAR